jgi:2-keto-4-pentenoate hydratase
MSFLEEQDRALTLPTSLSVLVDALVRAHKNGEPLAWQGMPEPASAADAEAVQDAVAVRLGADIGGWKVSLAKDNSVYASPMFSDLIWTSGAQVPLPRAGGLEIELAVTLAKDLPPRLGASYSCDEVLDAIGSVLIGIEILDSRLGDIRAPLHLLLSDNFSNAGYVTGTTKTDWRSLDLRSLRCTIEADGRTAFDKTGCHPQGDPLVPLVEFARSGASRLGGLRAGQVVTTGSLNGLLPCTAGMKITAQLDGIGSVQMTLGD